MTLGKVTINYRLHYFNFYLQEGNCYLVAMASYGYIYTQILSDESSAQHGPFYVTNVLQIQHPDLKVFILIYLFLSPKHFYKV